MESVIRSASRRFGATLRAFCACESGVAAVEFALILPAFLALTIGTMDVAALLYGRAALEAGARAASRKGLTGNTPNPSINRTTSASLDDIVNEVKRYAIGPFDITADSTKFHVYTRVITDFGDIPEICRQFQSNGTDCVDGKFNDENGNGDYDGATANSAGCTGQIVYYQITYDWTPYTPFLARFTTDEGFFPLTAVAIIQNEPWVAAEGGC